MTFKKRIERAEVILSTSAAKVLIDGIAYCVGLGEDRALEGSGLTDADLGLDKSWDDPESGKSSPGLWRKIGRRIAALARQRPEIITVGRALLEGDKPIKEMDDDELTACSAVPKRRRKK